MIGKFIKLLERFLKDKTYANIEINRADALKLYNALKGNIEKPKIKKRIKKAVPVKKTKKGRPRTRPATIKKRRTYKQARADELRRDKIKDAIEIGVDHISRQIDNNYMTAQEFLNDPSVYYDSQVMGKYKNSPVVTRKIEDVILSKYLF